MNRMNMHNKPRADAKLKNLPPERQNEIIEFGRTHSIDATVGWLRAGGVSSSRAAVSKFLQWRRERSTLNQDRQMAELIIRLVRGAVPSLTEQQALSLRDSILKALVIQHEDLGAFLGLGKGIAPH